MTPLRSEVIGLGNIAVDQHLPATEGDARFALAATVNPSGASSPTNFTIHEAMRLKISFSGV